ncbi:MAG TPA: argininosuccinate lyase, partial [Anaerolineaceae bacterium]
MKLWQGRIAGALDPLAARLNDSLPVDRRLAREDVLGSQAWARALARAGVITWFEAGLLVSGLQDALEELELGAFAFQPSDEDIHTAIERRLGELVGPLAGKLHTGRSRNDQVATDFRLWMLHILPRMHFCLRSLQEALVGRAEQDRGILLPGYTHFQQAQPVLLSHWWLSHFWALARDQERLADLEKRVRVMPLGSGALAGTAFPIDRFLLALDLGFDSPSPNSLDAVSDRDFAVEFLFWAALTGAHLSRLAEALILYSTAEFGFVTLADAYSTGSSLMPQKKNPDPLELARGKSADLLGKLTGMLATLKGLPSAYDKDLQEDKAPVFSAADLLGLLLPVMSGAVATLTIHPERMRAGINCAILATDLADYLVERGVTFRQAHQAAGLAVRRAEELGIPLTELPIEEWQAIQPAFQPDLFTVFDPERALTRRAAYGGTAPEAVQ